MSRYPVLPVIPEVCCSRRSASDEDGSMREYCSPDKRSVKMEDCVRRCVGSSSRPSRMTRMFLPLVSSKVLGNVSYVVLVLVEDKICKAFCSILYHLVSKSEKHDYGKLLE